MNTIVYFIRHSEKLKIKNSASNDSFQIQNEKMTLSVLGEEKAKKLSELSELQNVDLLITSNYVRTIETAKYIALKNNIEINVNDNFGERKVGINYIEEYPNDFELKQMLDENYKIGNGESQKEVIKRIRDEFYKILNNNLGKKIVIVFHSTAMLFLLKEWCETSIKGNFSIIKFKNKEVFNNVINAPEVFKLVFNDNNELIELENIKGSD